MRNPGSPAQMMLMVTGHDLRFPTRQSYLAKNERCISKTPHRYLLIPGCMQWYVRVPKPPSLSLSCLGRDNREQLLTGGGFNEHRGSFSHFFYLHPPPRDRVAFRLLNTFYFYPTVYELVSHRLLQGMIPPSSALIASSRSPWTHARRRHA